MVIGNILCRSEHRGWASKKEPPDYPRPSPGSSSGSSGPLHPSHPSHVQQHGQQHPNSGQNQNESPQLPSGNDIDKLVNRLNPKTRDQIDADIYPKTRTTGTIDVCDVTAEQRAQRQRCHEEQRWKRRPDQSDHMAQEQYERCWSKYMKKRCFRKCFNKVEACLIWVCHLT